MIPLRQKQSRKPLVISITILVVLVLVGLLVFSYYTISQQQPSSITDGKKTPPIVPKPTDRLAVEPHNYDPGAKQQAVEGVHTSDESAGAAAFPTTQPNLVVEITGTRQINGAFSASTTISPKAEGSCIVELTRLGRDSLTKTTQLVTTDHTTACKDTSIDITKVTKGEWTLTVKIQVGSNVATATKIVTLT